ncbi:MAG: flotillin-like FloA family protein, partial [Planctomycetota bacterium]|nr:flotillin-like FloA family protein [Planctomycetota bacterium]
MPPSNTLLIGGLIVGGIVLLIFLFIIGQYISLWFQALLSGARVRLIDLIMMRFRKVRPQEIVFNRISAKKAGIDLSS